MAASPLGQSRLRPWLPSLGGLGALAVLIAGPQVAATVLLAGLSLAGLAALFGVLLWRTLPESDRGPMGVASRADYENYGCE
ncbi:MAG: hypothetical protein ACKOET_14690 [Verrucomicrobiota bacterium]